MVELENVVSLIAEGRFAEAEARLGTMAEEEPGNQDILQLLSVVLLQQGEFNRALFWIDRSLALDDHNAGAHFNRAGALYSLGRWSESAKAYQRSLDLGEADSAVYRGLGCAMAAMGQDEDAKIHLDRALRIAPDCIESRKALSGIHERCGAYLLAASEIRRALDHEPYNIELSRRLADLFEKAGELEMAGTAYYNLGVSLQRKGDDEEAVKALEKSLALRPNSPKARYSLAMLQGGGVARAPEAYVAGLFDEYASRFDEHLNSLDYNVPERLVEALGMLSGESCSYGKVLDLGCGTGKCGSLLSGRCSFLKGVDLSAGMLKKASSKAVYDALERSEVHAHLEADKGAYDLILAADLLIYIGDCASLFAHCSKRLKPGGYFAFSIEAMADGDFRLLKTGRYAQSEDYIRKLLAQSGLELSWDEQSILRYQSRSPVEGHLFVASKPR